MVHIFRTILSACVPLFLFANGSLLYALILLVLSLAVCLILRKIPLLSKLVGG